MAYNDPKPAPEPAVPKPELTKQDPMGTYPLPEPSGNLRGKGAAIKGTTYNGKE